jgi:hypothetical protein
MKKIFDIRHIIIVILLLLAIVEFLNPKGIMPHRTISVHDTVGVPVHDTVGVEVPVEVEVEVPVEVEKPVPYAVHDTVAVNNPIDTNAILNALGQKLFKKDILKLPNNVGTVTVFDTISNSRIVGRSFKSDIKQKIKYDTLFLGDARKNLYYFGIDAKLDKPNVVNLIGLGFIIKDKDAKHLYKIGIGVSNKVGSDGTNGSLVPYIGGGVYWNVNRKK